MSKSPERFKYTVETHLKRIIINKYPNIDNLDLRACLEYFSQNKDQFQDSGKNYLPFDYIAKKCLDQIIDDSSQDDSFG